MSGVRGTEFQRLVARFNASQKQFRVVATYKGAHDEAVLEAFTARHTRRAPHLVQASELGAAFVLEEKDLARPLWQVAADSGAALNVEPALGGAEELVDAQGRLLALPIGRSTPVLYWNRDAFRIAMLDPAKPPATWYEMVRDPGGAGAVGQRLRANHCVAGVGDAREHGGVAQPGVRHRPAGVQQPPCGALGVDARDVAGSRATSPRPRAATKRKAGSRTANAQLLVASSGSYADLRSRAKFDLGIAQFPYYDDFDSAPLNTLSSGTRSG